jgi:uncharacterized protein YbdZ (MbtH family)
MEFSNPFDNPQGQFAILQNDQGQYSLWPQQCELPAGGAWCAKRSLRRRASSGWRNTGDA